MGLPVIARSKRPPTDFELLRAIYERHEHEYGHGKITPAGQKAEVLVPIDIPAIAATLGVDEECPGAGRPRLRERAAAGAVR